MITSTIRPLWEEMPKPAVIRKSETVTSVATQTPEIKNPFTDIFQSAIQAVKETDKEKNQLEYLMTTGQLDNPTSLILAANKASLSVSLLVQLRTRALEAYNELMRMNT